MLRICLLMAEGHSLNFAWACWTYPPSAATAAKKSVLSLSAMIRYYMLKRGLSECFLKLKSVFITWCVVIEYCLKISQFYSGGTLIFESIFRNATWCADTQCEEIVCGSPQEEVCGLQPYILHWWSNQLWCEFGDTVQLEWLTFTAQNFSFFSCMYLNPSYCSNNHFTKRFLKWILVWPQVFPRGWDKTFCLQFVENEFSEIHFFGDKTYLVKISIL